MLTDTAVKALRPAARPFKISDAAGLYLLCTPAGGKLWRYNFMVRGKQKTLSLGGYPVVSLAQARRARDRAKAELRSGADPAESFKIEKAVAVAAETTFAVVADDWYARKMVAEHKAANTLRRERWSLAILNAGIGHKPIGELEAPALLEVLRRIETAGNHEAAKRARKTAGAVFRFGIATGRCKRDISADLAGALTSKKARPRSAITDPAAVGQMLRDIDRYKRPEVRRALQLLMLVFTRPSELVLAEWYEIGSDGVWTIPASRMKARKEFHIPLSRQALAILEEMRGKATSRFIFPSRKPGKPIGADKLTQALRIMGYDATTICAHGFRSIASTMLNESGKFTPDTIELCLAHTRGDIRSIYNRAKHWPDRVTLMAWWADRLDELRARGEVVKLPPKKKSKAAVA